jgi:CHAD domain-containing protein
MTVERDATPKGLARQVELELDPLTGVGKGATGLDVIRSAVARSTIRLVSHEPITRVGEDPEGVHQARVAVRRLRSDLRTFRPLLDRDWAEALRVELRWLGRLLAPVRDAEVLGARLQERIEAMIGLELASAKVLLDGLEADRLEARRRLLDGLDSRRYGELVVRLVRAALEPVVRSGLVPGCPPPSLHATRIDAKRVRYGAEALAPVFGKRVSRFASAAEALQEVLGEHQDAVVAMAWLADRGIEAEDPAVAFTAGRLAELESASRDRARRRWPKAWKRLERSKRFWR